MEGLSDTKKKQGEFTYIRLTASDRAFHTTLG